MVPFAKYLVVALWGFGSVCCKFVIWGLTTTGLVCLTRGACDPWGPNDKTMQGGINVGGRIAAHPIIVARSEQLYARSRAKHPHPPPRHYSPWGRCGAPVGVSRLLLDEGQTGGNPPGGGVALSGGPPHEGPNLAMRAVQSINQKCVGKKNQGEHKIESKDVGSGGPFLRRIGWGARAGGRGPGGRVEGGGAAVCVLGVQEVPGTGGRPVARLTPRGSPTDAPRWVPHLGSLGT